MGMEIRENSHKMSKNKKYSSFAVDCGAVCVCVSTNVFILFFACRIVIRLNKMIAKIAIRI